MQVRVPVIVKDKAVYEHLDIEPTEQITVEADVFLDGPVSPRVAVLDFDPDSGALAPPARFTPPADPASWGSYDVPRPVRKGDLDVDPVATTVSVFGTVHKTIAMFEEQDALGRPVDWAFDAPQLLVVPRAGKMPNAYYERESHSLQFFFFCTPRLPRPPGCPDPTGAGSQARTYTANSQDIVAHETAHALLDGIAPDLYSAISPQSLAIHEAVADLASLLVSLRSRELTRYVLGRYGGQISNSNAFSGLAEEFAMDLNREGHYLRYLNNPTRVQNVRSHEPHDLSTVLSGAFYQLLLKTYDNLRQYYAPEPGPDRPVVAEPEAEYVVKTAIAGEPLSPTQPTSESLDTNTKALFVAAERIKRTLLRGLDYLPPGDVNFADLARAVLAADKASHPNSSTFREWLVQQFLTRDIGRCPEDLEVKTNFVCDFLRGVDIADLVASDSAAYQFAERNRAWLNIPPDTPFVIRKRLELTKLYWRSDAQCTVREVLFKASWSEREDNHSGGGLPRQRQYRAGTTLAIGLDRPEQPYVRALITSRRLQADREATDAMLKALIEKEQLHVSATASSGPPLLHGAIEADVGSGVLSVHGMARMLHVTAETR